MKMKNINLELLLLCAMAITKIKKIKIALLMVAAFVSLNAFSYDFTQEGIYYNISNKNRHELTVTSGDNPYSGEVAIPYSVSYNNEEYHVVAIGQRAFTSCTDLKKVSLPEGLEVIGRYSFQSCPSLSDINWPGSIVEIGEAAFKGCVSLTSAEVGPLVSRMGERAFEDCTGITSINIHDGCTLLSLRAFSGCTALATVSIPGSVESIGNSAFNGCTALEEAVIGNGVKKIALYAFYNCTALKKVSLPESLEVIGNFSFHSCPSLSDINWPGSIVEIGEAAFKGCVSLTSAEVGPLVSRMGERAFEDCTGITSINIHDGCTLLSLRAFSGCTALATVSIPGSVESIGNSVFNGCTALEEAVIGNGVKEIGLYAFYNCTALKKVSLPESLEVIDNFSFHSCPSLSDINWPGSIVEIGEAAFKGCVSLTSAEVGPLVSRMGERAFEDCTGITSINIHDGCTLLSLRAFSGCTALATVSIPGSVESIGNSVFNGCTALEEAVIGNGVKKIGLYAFSDCKNLVYLEIGEEVNTIAQHAFYNCPVISQITLHCNEIPSVMDNSFNNYEATLHIPARLVDAYSSHEIWGKFQNYIPISATLAVTFPNNYNLGDYKGLRLVLSSEGMTMPQAISDAHTYRFIGLPLDATCSLGLRNRYGHQVVVMDDIHISSLDNQITLTQLPAVHTVAAKVTDDKGNILASHASFTWLTEDGMPFSTGASIQGIPEGQMVWCQVSLDESIGIQYMEPAIQSHQVSSASNVIDFVLAAKTKIMVKGKVETEYGPASEALVNVTQWVNGKFGTTNNMRADRNGNFMMELYDDSTQIVVVYPGFANISIARSDFHHSNDLGVIRLEKASGTAIVTNVKIYNADENGPGNERAAYTNEINYKLFNKSKNVAITHFLMDGQNIIIPSGATPGDQVEVTASHTSQGYNQALALCTIQPNDSAHADLSLVELGSITAEFNASTSEVNQVLLYDESGNLMDHGTYTSRRHEFSHLPAGHYTIVSMGGDNIPTIKSLSDLYTSGIVGEGKFVSEEADVQDGRNVTSNCGVIPKLEDTVAFTDTEKSYLQCNKKESIAGNYVTLSTRAVFNEEYAGAVSNAVLVVDIPEDCQFVGGSVISDVAVMPYTIENNKLYIPISNAEESERFRFCVVPTVSGTQYFTAYVEFDCDGRKTRLIGSADVTVSDIGIRMISPFNQSPLLVSGNSSPGATVEIYDGDKLIGQAKTNNVGYWEQKCELNTDFNYSYHYIHALVHTSSGFDVATETKQILYDKYAPMPEQVIMSFPDDFRKNFIVTFDLKNNRTYPNSYIFTNPKVFTFIASLDKNEPDKIDQLYIVVYTDKNRAISLPATYNNDGTWAASKKFGSNELPVFADINYIPKYTDEFVYDDKIDDQIDQYLASLEERNIIISHVEDLDNNLNALLQKPEYDENEAMDMLDEIVDNMKDLLSVSLSDNPRYVDLYNQLMSASSSGEFNEIVSSIDLSYSPEINAMMQLTDISSDDYIPSVDLGNGVVLPSMQYISSGNPTQSDKGYGLWNIEQISDDTKSFYLVNDVSGDKIKFIIPDNYDDIDDCIVAMKNINILNFISQCHDAEMSDKQRFLSLYHTIMLARIKNHYGNEISSLYMAARGKFSWEILKKRLKIFGGTISKGYELYKLSLQQNRIDERNDAWKRTMDYVNEKCVTYRKIIIEQAESLRKKEELMRKIKMYYSISLFIIISPTSLTWAGALMKIATSQMDNLLTYYHDYFWRNKEEQFLEKIIYQYHCYPPPPSPGDFGPPTPLPLAIIRDPSGYVYEAVPSNRLEGVVTTVYQKVTEEDMYGDIHEKVVKWDAEPFGQKNPLITDTEGYYAWDVPQGWWQVKYEKDGYETATSNWLPVPPPQLEINQPMQHAVAPIVNKLYGYESGIKFAMSKYMRPETMLNSSVEVMCDGKKVAGKMTFLNMESDPYDNDRQYVSIAKFIPEKPFNVGDVVDFTLLKKHPESYCGVKMTEDFHTQVTIIPEITALEADSIVDVPYGAETLVRVRAIPAEAANGKHVRLASSSTDIMYPDREEAVFDNQGYATFKVFGRLSGEAYLKMFLDGYDLKKDILVNVTTKFNMVDIPKASMSSGSLVEKGYELELSCETPGATIYYTTDGSCPCDGKERKTYTKPIVLNESTVIKAIAVKEGMEDSDVATFSYTVYDPEGVSNVRNSDFGIWTSDRTIHVNHSAGDVNLSVYDLSARLLTSKIRIPNIYDVKVPKNGVYIVKLDVSSGKSVAYKVLVK